MTQSPNMEQSLEVAEAARETEWTHPSFAAELFVGNYRPELIFPYPEQNEDDRHHGDVFSDKLADHLRQHLDPEELDATRELPEGFLQGLVDLGAFGIKISEKYGGLGLSQTNYARAMSRAAGWDASVAVLLSAHQSIGVPVPLKMFGTEEQKKKYLPLLAKGAISAFALTEPDVGSDPARMSLTAVAEGDHWILNGQKLWCTNGPIADFLIVMARTPGKMVNGRERTQISAFIVEKGTPGFSTLHRCDFMGLKGIQNGLLEFKDVRIPQENILGKEGAGLKIALSTLNTGRLTLPAASIGIARRCLQYSRLWANKREQWGGPIAGHEAMQEKLARMASNLFAMEAVTWLPMAFVDRGGYDIRIEAAIAKLLGSEYGWRALDDTLQIRGGRGFETARSLGARGEEPWPVERMFRDNRINTLIEGSSEIMHLFLAREALDPHMRAAGALVKPRAPLGAKASAAVKAGLHYAAWYPRQWVPDWLITSQEHLHPELRGHGAWVARTARRLSRAIFHAMMRHQAGLEKRQLIMTRLVDIGVELYTVSAAGSRATGMVDRNPADRTPLLLADHYARGARIRVARWFGELGRNHDKQTRRLARAFAEGQLTWMEEGVI